LRTTDAGDNREIARASAVPAGIIVSNQLSGFNRALTSTLRNLSWLREVK
jgi:hypothetical protein